MQTKRRVLYSEANYEDLVQQSGYFVDKTDYIRELEFHKNVVFLRPRRFGKSLWCSILECYYDINRKDQFDKLFGHTAIGKNPTAERNSCMVLRLDFSIIDIDKNIKKIEESKDSAKFKISGFDSKN